MTSLVVSEIFGPTIQGEGPAAGRLATFVRLGGCNLACSWCDSRYTWDASGYDLRAELARYPLREVLGAIRSRPAPLVVITGGEPLLQQGHGYALPDLAAILAAEGRDVHVETNGTVEPGELLAASTGLFVVSPKLPHSGMPARRAVRWPVLRAFAALAGEGRAVLKVVCRQPGDCAEAAAIGRQAGFPPSAVWVMPEAATPAAVSEGLARLTPAAVSLGLNVTGRQHVLVWGNERGH